MFAVCLQLKERSPEDHTVSLSGRLDILSSQYCHHQFHYILLLNISIKCCYNSIQIVSDIDASQKPLSTYIFFFRFWNTNGKV